MPDPPSAAELRASFEQVAPGTLGIEEEVMLLDPETLELSPVAPAVLERLGGDPRFKLEFPASQLEITLGPFADVEALAGAHADARAELARGAGEMVRLACAGVHPFSPGVGPLNPGSRYERVAREYGPAAKRQLVCALQIHVAVGGAERTLAVYNALRSYLPLLAALAANAPFYEGRDCGLASVRPKLAELLPRQGVPPPLAGWEEYARALGWGARAGAFPDPTAWWWELRPHAGFGTLELRVPDAQTSVADAIAVAAVAHALVLWLARRWDAGEQLAAAPTWRIEENRWSATYHGVHGKMADLDSGEPRATRELLLALLDDIGAAAGQAAEPALARARALADTNGADAQRRVAEDGGAHAVATWLAGRFLAGADSRPAGARLPSRGPGFPRRGPGY